MDTQASRQSPYYSAEHEAFRATLRRFVGRELVAMYALRFCDELLRIQTCGVSGRKSPAGFTTVSNQMVSWRLLKLSVFPTDDLYRYMNT